MTIVPDFDRSIALPVRIVRNRPARPANGVGGSALYWRVKAASDPLGAIMLLPLIAVLACVLAVLNPLLNPGPVFYLQRRMGRDCAPFTALKFRTMRLSSRERGPCDPVEAHRITPLGGFLRRTGLDELPQAINILRGEMSLIGPRPDCIHHAEAFLAEIPEYRHRFRVRPGLSGLAQIRLGYAVGTEATRAKARTDHDYIARAGFGLDAYIVWRTLVTVVTGGGDQRRLRPARSNQKEGRAAVRLDARRAQHPAMDGASLHRDAPLLGKGLSEWLLSEHHPFSVPAGLLQEPVRSPGRHLGFLFGHRQGRTGTGMIHPERS